MMLENVVLIMLLVFSGFFSGLETAFVSLTHIQIRKLKEGNKKNALLVEKLKDDDHKLITTILICNNLVNISASALATYLTIQIFGSGFIGISTGVLTLVILVFGEVTPKRLAIDYNEGICLHSAGILKFLMFILTPGIFIIDKLSNIIISIFGKKEQKPKVTEEDIINAVELGEEIGELEPNEKRMIQNIFKFNDIDVKDIMTHRNDIFRLNENKKINEVIDSILLKGFSRIPVYSKAKDNIKGILFVKDVLRNMNKKETDIKIKSLMIRPLFVPESRKIDDMLVDFREKKTHIAVVIDEKGGLSGIITIENVLEEIVGEIYDEKDIVKKKIRRLNKNTYLIDGNIEIKKLNQRLKLDLIQSEEYEILSGYILRKTGKIPEEGKEIKFHKGRLKLEKVENNRIKLVKYIGN